jgi:hypothetical protein
MKLYMQDVFGIVVMLMMSRIIPRHLVASLVWWQPGSVNQDEDLRESLMKTSSFRRSNNAWDPART